MGKRDHIRKKIMSWINTDHHEDWDPPDSVDDWMARGGKVQRHPAAGSEALQKACDARRSDGHRGANTPW